MNKLTSLDNWLHGLFGGIIGGAASAGSAWMGMACAKSAGVDVPALNFKALGIILLSSGLMSAFAYLKQSPLPEVSSVTVTKETVSVEQSVTKSDKQPPSPAQPEIKTS
jgi:hypothetical protein